MIADCFLGYATKLNDLTRYKPETLAPSPSSRESSLRHVIDVWEHAYYSLTTAAGALRMSKSVVEPWQGLLDCCAKQPESTEGLSNTQCAPIEGMMNNMSILWLPQL
ncbi:hypothetical protein Pelo_7455 [Pelomyxa schiedti]|nr:hypothetical protein Pelo_7455 [Pelomyxa schiedti]